MSRRWMIPLAVGLLVGTVCGAVAVAQSRRSAAPAEAPAEGDSAAGLPVVAGGIRAGFEYDIHCTFAGGDPVVFRKCRLLGVLGEGKGLTPARSSGGLSSYSGPLSSGAASWGRRVEGWLVLRLADGRRAFIPPDAIRYLEDSAPPP